MRVLIFCSYVYSSKGRILIISSTCSSIFTSSVIFFWRSSIAFFDVGSFTGINTYLGCTFSLFLLGGVTRANITSGCVPGFVTGMTTTTSSLLLFFGVPVFGLSSGLRFLGMMGSLSYIVFDIFIFLIPFFAVSVPWFISILFGFSRF